MKVTFLIGNGFDINCGLKCTFREICEDYIRKESASEIIKHFKDNMDRNIDTWADFEIAMNQYLSNFKTEEEALECIRDFKLFMKESLKREEALFLSRISERKAESIIESYKDEIRESLQQFYLGINNNINAKYRGLIALNNTEFSFISYNYTRIFDRLLLTTGIIPSVIHIHGELNDETVVGIDSETQLNTNLQFLPSIDLRREFIKTLFNQEYDTNRVIYADSYITNCDVMCVFGMSLGDSDLSWRNKIIKWLKSDSNHHLFLYQYSCSNLNYFTVPHRMALEDKAKEAFFERLQLDDDVRNAIRERIHIPIGKNIFNINKVLFKAEKEQAEYEARIKRKNEDARQRSTGSMQGV